MEHIKIIAIMIMIILGIFCCVLAFFVMHRMISIHKEMRAIEYEEFKKLLIK